MFFNKKLIEQYLHLGAEPMPPVHPFSLVFFGIFLIIIGIVSIIHPQLFWHLRMGRKIPGVDPSSLYLIILRFGGLLTVILGLLFFYQAWLLS